MFAKLLPHPLLAIFIAIIWVFLANAFTLGNVILGAILGVGIAWFTGPFWPGRPRVRRPLVIAEFIAVVLWDIILSNIQVAKLVVFRRGDTLRSRFIAIPLDVRTPEAISALAGTITLTPGTVSADLSADGRTLLVHCLEVDDVDDVVATIKNRYERRLKEILE